MRHYIPKKNNPHQVPHNIYMQVLYLIRDYEESSCHSNGKKALCAEYRRLQWQAVSETVAKLQAEVGRKNGALNSFDALRAFSDYAYFSNRFFGKEEGMGATRRQWNLYRCKMIHRIAKILELII